jgi:hypothetical protein
MFPVWKSVSDLLEGLASARSIDLSPETVRKTYSNFRQKNPLVVDILLQNARELLGLEEPLTGEDLGF